MKISDVHDVTEQLHHRNLFVVVVNCFRAAGVVGVLDTVNGPDVGFDWMS